MKYMLGVKEEKRCKGQSLHLGVLVILFRELRHIRKESITLMVGGASLMVQWVKNLPAMQETQTQVLSLGLEDPLEEEVATIPVFLPRKSHGQRSLAGYSSKGHKSQTQLKAI